MLALSSNFATDRGISYSMVRLFGTQYYHQKTVDGGDLWLTEFGWSWRNHLIPEVWFQNGKFTNHGTRLGFSTGHVYRMESQVARRKLSFVVKISRVAQKLPSSGLLQSTAVARTSFSSPFEEIGQLSLLRASEARRQYLFTKRPLGVFSPGNRLPGWMLDRSPHEFSLAARRLASDSSRYPSDLNSKLEPDRDYFTLFSWVHGYNLEELVARGLISIGEMNALDREVRIRLEGLGFVVADHKPNHIIVRLSERGVPRRRRGQLVAALADFELLEQVTKS